MLSISTFNETNKKPTSINDNECQMCERNALSKNEKEIKENWDDCTEVAIGSEKNSIFVFTIWTIFSLQMLSQ